MAYVTTSPGLKSVTLYGPVAMGARLPGASLDLSPMKSWNCFFWMMLPRPETKIWYGYGFGSLNVTTTVAGSLASTLTTPSAIWVSLAAVLGSPTYCHVKTTSSAVNGVPSDHFTPGLSFQVIVVWSFETPPLSRVGISAARLGTGLPSGPEEARGSRISRPAS